MVRPSSPAGPRGSRVILLVSVLLLTLGLVAVLAFEAYRADRSHRQVTEQVLHDYVRFAALELARHANEEMYNRATSTLDKLACGDGDSSAARALAQLARDACGSCTVMPEGYVRFDPGEGRVVEAAGDLSATRIEAIETRLAALQRARQTGFGLLAVDADGGPLLIAWGNYATRPADLHAIVVPDQLLVTVIETMIDTRPLLPNALVEPGAQREYLKATLRLGIGQAPAGGDDSVSAFSAAGPLAMASEGDVRIVASLAAGAADSLIIGGLPRSRLPLLATLLFVGTGLIAVAVHQLRREHELARLRDAFVSGVSHELRTPLAQIRLFAETLRAGRVRSDEEAERSLSILDEEAERLSHMVDNLLAFNRAGRVTTNLTLAPLPLAPFVAETVERFAPLVRERRNRFNVDIPAALAVQADRDAMARVLTNLLENAVKYGPEGQTVRVSARQEGARARLIVDDEGPGVQRVDRGRIWEPFVRGGHRGAAATGTGIGLSVVRELMAAMGGSAWADDAPEGGARFVIELRAGGRPGAPESPLEPSGATA